ncbi:uncharacterized protein LOC130734536 [Lotus japonicus]|uniref:uncharacterized protein LOC130734536 n=1 Tax=Lotus japonicus TaxID=34305 RepID=UPI00258C6476|nr:uncharacterized protein LOC130734536 [Lotus japonicus]
MGNENHHHNPHLQFYHQKTMFLPILCSRPSIKDVNLPRCRGLQNSSFDDPLSPRIGCMGQVKRNNKIAGVPTSSHSHRLTLTATKSTTPVVKYSKLKKLFSGKNLIISTPKTTTAVPNSNINRCRTRQQQLAAGNNSAGVPKHKRCDQNQNQNLVGISIEEMDPPLPVIKKVPNLEEGSKVENSLWKRRNNGPAIKGLQLQQIHHPRICLQLDPTTV